MFHRWILALALIAAACDSDLSGDEGVDGGTFDRGRDGGFIEVGDDSDGGGSSEGRPSGSDAGGADPDAGEEPVDFGQATVTASCLFLRSGPGANHPKVACDGDGAECNADGDVCIPMGSTVDLTGEPESGSGCDQWFPLDYDNYSGYSCGTYLEVSGASALIRIKQPTHYPSLEEGPMG